MSEPHSIEQALEKYLSKWNLEKIKRVGDTPRGQVYKVKKDNQFFALKIFTDNGLKDEGPGLEFLKICKGDFLVRFIKHEGYALLQEYVNGPHLSSIVETGKDEEATKITASILHKIHTHSVPADHAFIPLRKRFRSLLERAGQKNVLGRAVALAEHYLINTHNMCLLHGDLHHNNIMLHPQRGWIAIDPKGLIGDPAFDLGPRLQNPDHLKDAGEIKKRFLAHVNLFSEYANIDPQKIIDYAFIYFCLSACWSEEDHEDPAKAFMMANMIESVERGA